MSKKRKKRRKVKGKGKPTPPRRVEVPNHIIAAYADEAPEVFVKKFRQDCCINATRVLLDVFRHFDMKARPLSVECAVHNKMLVDFIAAHNGVMPAEEVVDEWYEKGAWGVRIEGEVVTKDRGWAGHLVGIVQDRWLVDSSSGQMSRPEKGIHLPPILVAPATRLFLKARERCILNGPEGAVILYGAKLDDKSYETASGFQRHDFNREVAAEIIARMSKRLGRSLDNS